MLPWQDVGCSPTGKWFVIWRRPSPGNIKVSQNDIKRWTSNLNSLDLGLFIRKMESLIPISWASLVAQLVKNPPVMGRSWFDSWIGKIPWRMDRLPTPVFFGFPCGSAGKEPACDAGDLGSIPGLGRPPGEGKGYPLQCFGLENPMDCIVHGVTKCQGGLSNFHFHFHFSLT